MGSSNSLRILLTTIALSIWGSVIFAQMNDNPSIKIQTILGEVVVYQRLVESENKPVIFLHGLFFNHHLWDYHTSQIKDRNVYVLDMPLHGQSMDVYRNWDLQDCAKMLIEILEKLNINQVHAVGHSWGGMTMLRAAELNPEKFRSLTFFNTPFIEYTKKDKRIIKLQHLGLMFKKVFIKKASENIFDTASLKSNPSLFTFFETCMQDLSNKNIKYLNKVVRIDATNTLDVIENLEIKHQIIVGKNDKIAPAPTSESILYEEGGHTTPLEYPENSANYILSFIKKI